VLRLRLILPVVLLLAVPAVALPLLLGRWEPPADRPWLRVPVRPVHVDHARLLAGPFADGPAVTRACLECHPRAASEMLQTAHWTWAGQKVKLPGRAEPLLIGKRNVINNFCIHAGPNIARCSSCHAGYGWRDAKFDFGQADRVDCLVCHEQTGTYRKGEAGNPERGVDLVAVARSVARPVRGNCGTCHFKGGGGDAVKHGDLDGSMYFPRPRIDVHMGRLDFQCVDCHRSREHRIAGAGMPVADNLLRVACTDCHSPRPHKLDRLNAHTRAVACQTCHIPTVALDAPTKTYWDWSTAGQDGRKEDPHVYLKQKGSFQYTQNLQPEYHWFNGRARRYLTGDKVDPAGIVEINAPLGSREDPQSQIWPFKVHRGKQIYDKQYAHLLAPKTAGPGGYWSEFDWDKACRLGSEAVGLPYSGQYGFVETVMYWPLSHMVQAKHKALRCDQCHGDQGMLDWRALGYETDPAYGGSRRTLAGGGR
jgi:octaheme c-type cytochrome (tetrathionate reductase family)